MSLVAYGSSDDSDSDDTSSGLPEGKLGGLFSSLPTPKNAASDIRHDKYSTEPNRSKTEARSLSANVEHSINSSKQSDSAALLQKPQNKEGWSAKGLLLDLPKPKKRTEPVKITVPEIKQEDSDSDNDEPVRKKAASQGSGLSSLLPQPKNLVVKETQRALVPHTLTKRPARDPQAQGGKGVSHGVSGTSASPSAIKAAAKSAALQVARQMAVEEDCSDEELAPDNYFSLSDKPQPNATAPQHPVPPVLPPPLSMENHPLDFGSHAASSPGTGGAWGSQQKPDYQQQYEEPPGELLQGPSEDYYGGEYCQGQDVVQPDASDTPSVFDDEAFRRLQGKQNRGKEEVKFLEIKGDDQLSGSQQWMTKGMSKETEQRKSFSKKKGDQPTGQQRRKHQITYLIHQAKERELELKNSWADNKMTRRQTQAKYGF